MAIRLWIRNGKVVVVGRLCPIPIFWSASIYEAAWWHNRPDDPFMPIKDHDHAWPCIPCSQHSKISEDHCPDTGRSVRSAVQIDLPDSTF
jgi:hypothetical protein